MTKMQNNPSPADNGNTHDIRTPIGANATENAAPNANSGANTRAHLGVPADLPFEGDSFDARIRGAYESIEPTAEAEQRMLDKLLAHQKEVASQAAGGVPEQEAQAASFGDQLAAGRSIGGPVVPASPQPSEGPGGKAAASKGSSPATKRRTFPWKIAIPAAACLLLALGVGALVALDDPAGPALNQTTAGAPAENADMAEAPAALESSPADELAVTEDSYMAREYDSYPPVDPGVYNTEEYNAVDEPGFVSTATRPLSTFGADVDTASYANLRRLINEGNTIADVYDEWAPADADGSGESGAYDPYYSGNEGIPKGAVRIEEMLNYFTYDYALPQGDELFGTTVSLGDCPWNPDTKLLVMGFATNPEVGNATAGRNLVFLIDTSGSMDEPNKIGLLQDAFAELTSQLNDNDRVSIVTYAGAEEVVLDGAQGSDARSIQRAIDRLRPNGSTNGEAGLKMAYEVAEHNFIEGGVNRIVMASDGDLNVGISSESDLHDFVEGKRDTGVYLSVLGFGAGNYKDNKMEALADAGNGNYHYIDCLEEAEKVFGSDLVANLVPLANDVKLQVEFNPAQMKGYRLIGYENRSMADEDFRDDTKDAGDVGPGHQLTVAYEVVPVESSMDIPEADLKYGDTAGTADDGDGGEGAGGGAGGSDTAGAANGSDEWLTCTMRYQPVAKADGDGFVVEASDAREQSVVVRASDLKADPGNDWRFAASVIEFGMVLRDSEFKGSATFDTIDDLLANADLQSAERKDFQRLVRKAE